MILYGTDLINTLRKEFDKAEKRIYIAVPFIGGWESVKKIMGTKWAGNSAVEMKILTDIANEGFIDPVTISQFLHRGEVRSLRGLHAKIYIIDNSVFITSANLTGTAFSKRYEICEFFTIKGNHEIIDVFKQWWTASKKVDTSWQPKHAPKEPGSEEGNTAGLKKLWDLPESMVKVRNFKDYQDNIIQYNHFLKLYQSDTERLIPDVSAYHELDAFFDYLFHSDPIAPSKVHLTEEKRNLTDAQRMSELQRYKRKFERFLEANPRRQNYRRRIALIQEKLKLQEIANLDRNSLPEVIDCLHPMESHALNRYRFLNPDNNKLKTIKKAFQILLHDDRPIEERMELCNSSLNYFGKSCIKELVAWYYPDQYPIMNRNTNSGMKFFGYDINTY